MEILPGVPLPLALALLALLDGLSIGTLLIPLFLLLAPGRVRGGRMLLYLGTIGAFYLVVGVLFLLGLINVVDVARGFLASPAGVALQLAAGLALLATGLVIDTRTRVRKRALARVGGGGESSDEPEEGRLTRWRDRLVSDGASRRVIVGVALAAGLVEVATMLPYILAMTMLADSAIALPLQAGALVGYCVLMIAPALVLLLLRIVAARVVDKPLRKLAAWLQRTASENTVAILVIVGFLVARSAATELGLFEWLASLRD
jgi:hypothetical protein